MKKRKAQFNKRIEKRKPVAPGSKKNEPGLSAQHSRTGALNALAGAINDVVRIHAPLLRSRDLYHRLLRIFRKADVTERLLLLHALRDLEVNPAHEFGKLAPYPLLVIEKRKGILSAALEMNYHIYSTGEFTDSYYLHLVVCLWNKTAAAVPECVSVMTEWILLDGGVPAYEIDLGRHGDATEWLAFVRVVCGWKCKDEDMLSLQGMRVFGAGSFTKAGRALLELHEAKLRQQRVTGQPEKDPVKRIAPVRLTDTMEMLHKIRR